VNRAILTVVCTTLAAAPAAGAACEVFENQNFAGESMAIERNQSLPRLDTLNDRVSSIKVASQCLLVAYADEDYRGVTTTFSQGEHASLPKGWDDEISSLHCNCR
jgi:Beta/Gamma crystallin